MMTFQEAIEILAGTDGDTVAEAIEAIENEMHELESQLSRLRHGLSAGNYGFPPARRACQAVTGEVTP